MLGHNLLVDCMDRHLFTNVIKFTTRYDRIGASAVMALRGRLACIVDHLGYLGYLGCSVSSEFFELRRSGEKLSRVQNSIALFVCIPGTWYLRATNRANAAIFLL